MADKKPIELLIETTVDGQSPVELLAKHCDLSLAEIKATMSKGAVWVKRRDSRVSAASNHRRAVRLRRAGSSLNCGDILLMNYNPEVLALESLTPSLIEDCGHFSVWNKPAGMLCQGSRWSDHTTLYRWAEIHLSPQRPSFLIHRLDRMTSGLTVLAHNKKVAAYLAAQFETRQTRKHYRVVVEGYCQLSLPYKINMPLDGKPSVTTIQSVLGRSDADIDLNEPSSNRWPNEAILRQYSSPYTVLEVAIQTGRKHQIRRHLSALGFPVVGDRLYGHASSKMNEALDLQLHAHKLSFLDPNTDARREYCV